MKKSEDFNFLVENKFSWSLSEAPHTLRKAFGGMHRTDSWDQFLPKLGIFGSAYDLHDYKRPLLSSEGQQYHQPQ